MLLLSMESGLVNNTDHSTPSSARVKDAWTYASTSQNIFMVGCLIKHRVQFGLALHGLSKVCALVPNQSICSKDHTTLSSLLVMLQEKCKFLELQLACLDGFRVELIFSQLWQNLLMATDTPLTYTKSQ